MKASRPTVYLDPLTAAVCEGDVEKVLEFHFEGVTDSTGLSPLSRASCEGQLEIVKSLIRAGADVNAHDTIKHGGGIVSALFLAASNGHTDVVTLLLHAQADWGSFEIGPRRYPLCAACYNGHLDVVRLLLAAGARVNPASGENPLKAACQGGAEAKKSLKKKDQKRYEQYVKIVNLLLAAGAKQ